MTDTNMRNFTSSGILNNPHQGSKKKIVFVCSAGVLRSATASHIYADKFNTRCAGTLRAALIPFSENLCAWADEIVFVNKENYLQANPSWVFLYKEKIKVLDIPDTYGYMDKTLVEIIKTQYEKAVFNG